MNQSHIDRLADMLNPAMWKNPERSIRKLLEHNKGQDPRKLAWAILREGTVLPKDEKKKYGINASAKVFTSVFGHFTDEGLRDCVRASTELAYGVESIEMSLSKIKDWGVSKMVFSPAPDTCPICKKLKGVYDPENIPIPVLDTHLGCRCCFSIKS